MNVSHKLAVCATLLALAHTSVAAEPVYRRPTRPDRYDPFQEDETAGSGSRSTSETTRLARADRDTKRRSARYRDDDRDRRDDRYQTESASSDDRNRSRPEETDDFTLENAFRPISYQAEAEDIEPGYAEPEYVVDDVDVYHPFPPHHDSYCDVDCGNACGYGGCGPTANSPPCRWVAFGEYLLLRPRGFDVAYAVELDVSNVNLIGTNLTAPVQQVDPTSSSGFRAGVGLNLSPCERFDSTFTHFEGDDFDTFDSTPAGDATSRMQALAVSQSLTEDWDRSAADFEVDFQLLDFDYRRQVCGVEWFAGIRLAWLDQDLVAEYQRDAVGVRLGLSNVEFQGAGLRFGLGKEHRDPCLGWLVYVRGAANFLGGQFDADFQQVFDGATTPQVSEADTSWQADRLVTMFDLEMGFGWEDPCGRWRLTAGYMVNYWLNVVTTDEWLSAVQTSQFDDVSSNVGFDGLATRAELRF